jgi:hypothetical protein
MNDNVTTNAIISFIWSNPIIAAILGAAVALIGREVVDWFKRPRLKIDFEEREGQKPYITDFNDEMGFASGLTFRVRYLRLRIRNNGRKPAMNCESKLEVVLKEAPNSIDKVALHWSRRNPALYSEYGEGGVLLSIDNEKVFAPIDLNINDEETVDVFRLRYSFSTTPDTDRTPKIYPHIESVSLWQLQLQPNTTYNCKVTAYASNTIPKSFEFKVNWAGTLDGFNKAFTKC